MAKRKLTLIIAVVLIIAALTAVFLILRPSSPPRPALEEALSTIEQPSDSGLISGAAFENFSAVISGDPRQSFRTATAEVEVTYLDTAALADGIDPEMQTELTGLVDAAKRPTEIYTDSGEYLPEVLASAYDRAINKRLEHTGDYLREDTLTLHMSYSGGDWEVDDLSALYALASPADDMPGFEKACTAMEHIDFHYTLPDLTSPGPKPDQSRYGETTDPAVISALLETDEAKKLIDGQELDWNPDKELINGGVIRYYLDETILAIVWQESEHGAVGTFAEVFIADASQLRRKIADDTFGGQTYYYPTELAAQANAVLAVSGDFYDIPDRCYGLYAYDGKLMRSCLTAGQACLFTDSGDMLFTYEGQFKTEAEAQAYLDKNNIMFSLSFGPVMVENGVDVTPYDYPLGEVRDTYARCAIGQLGKLHYLAMTINCQSPDYYVYVTLRQAADSMIAHGCYNAYTLDGGQTGSIIIGNELINPVQFGVERRMSDIFYFATAIPEN